MKVHVIIPARRNSKGLPFKNRKLIDYTLRQVPDGVHLTVTTDDEVIKENCENSGVRVLERSSELSSDTASIRPVMQDAVSRLNLNPEDVVVMLYLTYPGRTWKDVEGALDFMYSRDADSLLCRKSVPVHPCLMMLADGDRGRQVIEHDMYRRQDYPEAFEISHYVCAFRVRELERLNTNMYNGNTVFYPIDDVIDVDYEKDLMRFTDPDATSDLT